MPRHQRHATHRRPPGSRRGCSQSRVRKGSRTSAGALPPPFRGAAPRNHRTRIHGVASSTNAAPCNTFAMAIQNNGSNRTSPPPPCLGRRRWRPPPTVTGERWPPPPTRPAIVPTPPPMLEHWWGAWAALAGRGGGMQAGTTPLKSLFSHFLFGRLIYHFQRGVIMAPFLL